MIKTKLNKLKNMSEIIRKININGVDYNISPVASEEQLGMVKLGPGLDIDGGTTVVNGKDGIIGDFSSIMVDEGWLKNYLDTNFDFSATPQPEIPLEQQYFTVEALEDGLTAKLSTKACEYRINNGDWSTLNAGTNTVAINTGQTLQFRAELTPTLSGIGTFTFSKKCNLKGNIMSLLYKDDFIDKTDLSKNYTFYRLFKNNTNIINANKLILPAITLANYYYDEMFRGCTSLTTAPQLPATTLANSCYRSMFYDCTSLTEAPQLPATTLADSCYQYMFKGCTRLTTAPELPATTLAGSCYSYMFSNTNVLPDCSNIDFTSESVVTSGSLRGLFAYTKVTDSDLMQILPLNDKGRFCLPATTLANSCYHEMFYGCTELITAPELPATTLAEYCYQYMFSKCTSLITPPSVLPATTLARWCCGYMFQSCTSLTTAPELPATTLADSCYGNMFQNCTSLTTAPELPATTLAEYCYQYMFSNCTSLTTAPELPATTLASYCYKHMFYNCTSLNYIKMLANSIKYNYLENWVSGVSSTGTFVKLADATYITGPNGIPEGWTIENV